MIALDTNVISELMRDRPDPGVVAAVDTLPSLPMLTAISTAEIRLGIAALPQGARRRRLSERAARVFDTLSGRVLPFDEPASSHYARIATARRASGRPISRFDAMIAAICAHHGAGLITRNVGDFADTGITVINPWAEETGG